MPLNIDPNADASIIIKALVEAKDPAEAAAWLDANVKNLGPQKAGVVGQGVMATGSVVGQGPMPKVDDTVRAAGERAANYGREAAKTAEGLAQQVVAGNQVGADLDKDGSVTKGEQALLDQKVEGAKEVVVKQASKATNRPEEVVEQEVEQGILSMTGGLEGVTPELIKQFTGGKLPTDKQKRQLVTTYNEQNPDAPVDSYDDLKVILTERGADPFVQSVVESAFLGTEPIISYQIPLSNGEVVHVDAAQYKAFTSAYGEDMAKKGGFNTKDLASIVRIAHRVGLKDASGGTNWQMLTALIKARDIYELDTKIPDPIKAGPNGQVVNVKERLEAGNKQRKADHNLQQLGLRFNEGMTVYGNDTLAYLHTLDSSLASRVANTKPEKLAQGDLRKAKQLLINGGFSPEQMANMGYSALSLDDFDGIGGGRYQDPEEEGAGPTRTVPDPVALRQAAKDMYKTLFLKDPTPEQLEAFANRVGGAIAAAPDEQSVDASAQMRDMAEKLPEYQELYGRMPGGMTEGEYRNQFTAGASSILGNEAPDPEMIRQGMRQGMYQTTVGAAAGSAQAQNNSTWLGRLAQAAEIVSSNT